MHKAEDGTKAARVTDLRGRFESKGREGAGKGGGRESHAAYGHLFFAFHHGTHTHARTHEETYTPVCRNCSRPLADNNALARRRASTAPVCTFRLVGGDGRGDGVGRARAHTHTQTQTHTCTRTHTRTHTCTGHCTFRLVGAMVLGGGKRSGPVCVCACSACKGVRAVRGTERESRAAGSAAGLCIPFIINNVCVHTRERSRARARAYPCASLEGARAT
jgi:hypothetical protein